MGEVEDGEVEWNKVDQPSNITLLDIFTESSLNRNNNNNNIH